jgi:hypothetical protein
MFSPLVREAKAVCLNGAEATAMDFVIGAHELGTSLTAASSGDQATLESLLAKWVLKSPTASDSPSRKASGAQ